MLYKRLVPNVVCMNAAFSLVLQTQNESWWYTFHLKMSFPYGLRHSYPYKSNTTSTCSSCVTEARGNFETGSLKAPLFPWFQGSYNIWTTICLKADERNLCHLWLLGTNEGFCYGNLLHVKELHVYLLHATLLIKTEVVSDLVTIVLGWLKLT